VVTKLTIKQLAACL